MTTYDAQMDRKWTGSGLEVDRKWVKSGLEVSICPSLRLSIPKHFPYLLDEPYARDLLIPLYVKIWENFCLNHEDFLNIFEFPALFLDI